MNRHNNIILFGRHNHYRWYNERYDGKYSRIHNCNPLNNGKIHCSTRVELYVHKSYDVYLHRIAFTEIIAISFELKALLLFFFF